MTLWVKFTYDFARVHDTLRDLSQCTLSLKPFDCSHQNQTILLRNYDPVQAINFIYYLKFIVIQSFLVVLNLLFYVFCADFLVKLVSLCRVFG